MMQTASAPLGLPILPSLDQARMTAAWSSSSELYEDELRPIRGLSPRGGCGVASVEPPVLPLLRTPPPRSPSRAERRRAR